MCTPTDLPEVKIIKTHIVCAELGGNGNVYFVDDKLNLCLAKRGTDSIKKFSVANYGSNPVIDAGNPLEIFVFFATTGKIVVFDNQLNVQQELNMYANGYMQPLAFGRANDGNAWLLDNNTRTLKKFSRQGELLTESVILKNWTADESQTTRIFDNGSRIALADADGKIYAFNQNLFLETIVEGNYTLLGLADEGIYGEKAGIRWMLKEPLTPLLHQDSTGLAFKGRNTRRMNAGWLLESTDSTLILQSRK